MEDMTLKFAKAIYYRRKELGLTQEELAEKVGTTKQVVSKYELGQRSPKIFMANAFAEALGTTLNELLGVKDESELEVFNVPLKKPQAVYPQTDEVRILVNGFNKLPHEQQKQALDMFRVMFERQYPDLFEKETAKDDNT